MVAPENIFPIPIFPDVEQSIAEQSKSVKVGQNTPSSNPVSDDPPLISWSLDLIQVYKQTTNKQIQTQTHRAPILCLVIRL